MSHSEYDLQRPTDLFATASRNVGLSINMAKSEVQYQPPPSLPSVEPKITIEDSALKSVHHFAYFESVLSSDATIGD